MQFEHEHFFLNLVEIYIYLNIKDWKYETVYSIIYI